MIPEQYYLQLFRGLAYKNKPFSIGEYNHPYFTDYSVESPFYVTAYSSLHDAMLSCSLVSEAVSQ